MCETKLLKVENNCIQCNTIFDYIPKNKCKRILCDNCKIINHKKSLKKYYQKTHTNVKDIQIYYIPKIKIEKEIFEENKK
jgi:hypothetical protein